MLIKIQNFGFIKNIEFDLDKDFTLIYGKNNIGKSYALYVVYLILKSFSSLNVIASRPFFYFDKFFEHKLATDLVSEIKNTKNGLSIKETTEKLLRQVFERYFLSELENSFNNTFPAIDNLQNKLSNERLVVQIELELLSIHLTITNEHLAIEKILLKKSDIVIKDGQRNLSIKLDKPTVTLYRVGNSSEEIMSKVGELIFLIARSVALEVNSKILDLHFLPASRSGLYQALSAFGQIIAELSKNRQFFKSSIEIPGLSEPVSDYFISLSSIDNKKIKETDVVRIAREIEENILHGEVKFDTKTKKIIYAPNNMNFELDLSHASSMVSELSPIVSYLKHILPTSLEKKVRFGRQVDLQSKILIFIEEPEAHLHPKVQIELLKYFAELTKYRVKIIMTTHSNYMFNKFNNLIASETLSRDSVSSILFEETKEGSIGRNVEIDRFGVDDSNFADVSEELYMEKMEIIKNINSKKG